MGCDIHVIVERRQNADSPWAQVKTRGYFERPNHHNISKSDWRPLASGEVDAPEALTARNYDVFGLLANVRNGRGFAGIKTADGWTPLDEPRGIPTDSTYQAEGDENYWLGDHSFSYATVRELLTFFATPQETIQYGVLSLDEYLQWAQGRTWKGRHSPASYSGDISGPNIIVIPEVNRDAHATKAKAETLIGKRVHVRASWPETAIQAASGFYESALPWLTALGNPDDVRIVFGFDS